MTNFLMTFIKGAAIIWLIYGEVKTLTAMLSWHSLAKVSQAFGQVLAALVMLNADKIVSKILS